MKSAIVVALAPLAYLLGMASLACLLSFAVLQLSGDVLPLAKLTSKTTLGLLLLSLFPLKKHWQLGWGDFGFAPARLFFRQIGQGLGLALLTLMPVLLALYSLDVQVIDSTRHWDVAKILIKIASGLGLALLIALAEETLFRGLLLSMLRRHLPLIAALFISSAYYAALHFLKSHSQISYAQQSMSSGFVLMQEAFANWLNPKIFSAWLALFMVGLFLAQIRTRLPASLGICMGCHAGWVWQIKVCKDFFNLDPHAEYAYLVSSYDGVIGPLVSVWLGATIVVWWLAIRFTDSSQS